MTHEDWMRQAIEVCREGIAAGQTPFGAVIVRDGVMIARTHNTVWRDLDSTCHAEINAIRQAEKQANAHHLSGAVLYSTCEPCPMCLAAIHWAKVATVYFGARISDASDAGFHEMPIDAETMIKLGRSPLIIGPDLLRAECTRLFAEWKARGHGGTY